MLKKPLIDGSILLFDGQATVYLPGKGCYRCLFPAPPPPGMVPSCAEAGVLGALCGTIGTIQATEVLKLILGVGEPLANRLLLYDALAMEFRAGASIRRDPNCPLCGDNPTVTELIDYEAFCGGAVRPHEREQQKASDAAPTRGRKRHGNERSDGEHAPAARHGIAEGTSVMAVEVKVTSVLQKLTGAKIVEGEGGTVAELLDDLDGKYPGFKSQLMTKTARCTAS